MLVAADLFSAAVLLWVSGFDIIYALQDIDFDKSLNLNSIPVKLGRVGALRLSIGLHIICAAVMIFAAYQVSLGYPSASWLSWVATAFFIGLLFYQHTLVKPNDLSQVDLAFCTTNGVTSLVCGSVMIFDLFI